MDRRELDSFYFSMHHSCCNFEMIDSSLYVSIQIRCTNSVEFHLYLFIVYHPFKWYDHNKNDTHNLLSGILN